MHVWFSRGKAAKMMKKMVVVLVCAGLLLAGMVTPLHADDRVRANEPLLGLDYGPYREGQAPWGVQPTEQEVDRDLALMARKVDVLRIYSARGISQTIVARAAAHGLDVVVQAWIGTDAQANMDEIQAAITLANTYPNVIAVLVGSEVLLRGDQDETTLCGYLDLVRTAVSVPVGYADGINQWLGLDPSSSCLLARVDWVGLHAYGFGDCVTVYQSASYAYTLWNLLKTSRGFDTKRVILFETGWPNAGRHPTCRTITGSKNAQAWFTREMVTLAAFYQMDLFLFEFADEPWKCEGGSEPTVGCHWGLVSVNRRPNPAWAYLSRPLCVPAGDGGMRLCPSP